MNTLGFARKEMLTFLRDRRLLAAALLIAALGLAALAAGFGQVRAYERDRQVTEAQDRQTWLGQGERNPHTAAHLSMWALRPLSAPALLDPGVFPYAGAAVWMEAHNRNPARNRPIEDRAAALDVGQFSAAWILQTLLPLVIMIIAAGAVAREREQGTFRLLLAGGLSATRLAGRKLQAVLLITGMLTLPLVAVGFIAVIAAGGAVDAAVLARLGLWVIAYGVWFAIIALVAIAVSAVARNTASAIIVLIAIWLAAVFVAPRAGAAFADLVAPAPAADRFWSDVGADLERFPPDIADQFKASVLQRYGVSRVEDLPVSFAGLQLEWGEGIGHQVFDANYDRLNATYAKQREASRWANLFSPLPALQNVSMALAGTDQQHQQSFHKQAEAHRREVVGLLNRDMIQHGRGQDFNYKAGADLWARAPAFAYQPPPTMDMAAAIWPDVLILIAWLVIAMLLFRIARRHLAARPA